jgi:hypothetical protein
MLEMSMSNLHEVTSTTLDEIPPAISDFYSGYRLPLRWYDSKFEPEWLVLKALFQQHAARLGNSVNDKLCTVVTLLVIETMFAQQIHNLQLVSRSQHTFCRG